MSAKCKQTALALLASATMFFAAPGAFAKLIWQDFSISYLEGSDYHKQPLGPAVDGGDPIPQTQANERQVWTFEHASGHTWGGTFLFIDRLSSDQNGYPNDAMYGEFSVNPNLVKGQGFFKSLYLSGQMEFGAGDNGNTTEFNLTKGNSFNNTLLGAGVNLAVPGSTYFNVVFYRRYNDNQGLDNSFDADGRNRPNNEQVTLTWRFDFGAMRFDGFMDYATAFDFGSCTPRATRPSECKSETSMNFTPQLKVDIGRMFGATPKKLWAGVEYVYWQNKFGVEDWDEENPNLMLKWHF